MKALPPRLLLVQTFVLRFRKLKCEKSGWLGFISCSKWAHWRTEARPQEYRPGLSMPQTGVWGLSFCPLTPSPGVSTHSAPADGVDSTLLVITTFSLQVSFLTLCSLWRSPSLKDTSWTLKDSSVTLETICTHLVVLWGHPACLIQESVPRLSSAFPTVSLLSPHCRM